MKRTIYLPDELNARIERYLQEHPGESVSSVAQRALKKELSAEESKDLTPLLELAGFVELKSTEHNPKVEDSVVLGRTAEDT